MQEHKIPYVKKSGYFSSHETILRQVTGSGSVLDLGASNGILYNDLKARGFDVTCVDYVPAERVTMPREDYVFCNLEKLDELKLTKKYDYIILADVIEHLRNGPELLRFVKQYLKEGGHVVISVPNIAIWVYRLSLLLGRFDYTEKGTLDETHIRFYTKKTILQLMDQTGYQVQSFVSTGLPFEAVVKSLNGSSVLNLIGSVYYVFAKIWPSLFAYQFVLKVR
jgi:2-polyprenyl-3-methyl-5-hydroxy-6-metoxy-1,4-benzoquinol methylase